MEEEKGSYGGVTPQELFQLTLRLYESSLIMKRINVHISDVLLELSMTTMEGLDEMVLGEEDYADIQTIKEAILCNKDS